LCQCEVCSSFDPVGSQAFAVDWNEIFDHNLESVENTTVVIFVVVEERLYRVLKTNFLRKRNLLLNWHYFKLYRF